MAVDRNSILSSHCVNLTFAWVTVRLLSRVFAFYVQCLTGAGVSQPSFNVVKEFRISQGPQSY